MENSFIFVRNLVKRYGKIRALKGISMEIPQKEMFGIVGPDGAGKTTLIRILAGILPYDSGEVVIMGKSLKGDIDSIRNEIGYISQRFSLYGDLTVQENIDFFMEVFPSVKNAKTRKKELLALTGLTPFADRLAANLSGGMKQKLSLCCALIHNPKFLLMDEPTTGVDPVFRREFWGIIFQLQREGLTVLASTPYMDEAEQFDRVALMNNGEFIRIGTVDEIRNSIPGRVVEVMCDQPLKARKALRDIALVRDVELFGDKIHVFVDEVDEGTTGIIRKCLQTAGVQPGEIALISYSIEDVFLKVSAGRSPDSVTSALGGGEK